MGYRCKDFLSKAFFGKAVEDLCAYEPLGRRLFRLAKSTVFLGHGFKNDALNEELKNWVRYMVFMGGLLLILEVVLTSAV